MKPAEDLRGRVFERWTVKARAASSASYASRWECVCECGTIKIVDRQSLVSKRSKSCGCLNREIVRSLFTKHGLSGTRVFEIWRAMISRCENPKNIGFHRYGGRGIRVCDRWKSPEAFISDMGDPPSAKHSLERMDNDGPYSPENCHWGTKFEQDRNMSTNHWLTHSNGTRMILTDWARQIGISAAALQTRIDGGWPLDFGADRHQRFAQAYRRRPDGLPLGRERDEPFRVGNRLRYWTEDPLATYPYAGMVARRCRQ